MRLTTVRLVLVVCDPLRLHSALLLPCPSPYALVDPAFGAFIGLAPRLFAHQSRCAAV